jgi:DNA-directed RNA polymerase specialized sigma24 family protein
LRCSLLAVPHGPGSPTHEAIRALLQRPDLRARLVRHAYARCRSASDASDFVHEAITRVLEGRYPWSPAACPELIDHLGSVINTLVWNRATSAAAARERALTPEHVHGMADDAPSPEERLLERETALEVAARAERWMRALRERLQGDEAGLAVLDLFESGVTDPGDQAREASRPRAEIDRARRRIGYHAEAVKRTETLAEPPPSTRKGPP